MSSNQGYRLGGVRHDDDHSLRAATTAIPGERVEREFRCICGVEFGLQYDTNARIEYRRHRLTASRRRQPKAADIPPLKEQGSILRKRYLYAGEQSLASITDPDARIEVMQDRLAIAVDYTTTFRSSDEPEQVEACEKAIRFANMLSQAILATAVRRPS